MSSERTVRVSLSVRLSLLIFIVTLGTGTALTVTGYAFYQRNMERKYISLGQGLTDTAAEILSGEDLERYLAGGVDEGYAVTRALLRNLFKHNALTTLYVVKFIPDGSVFLFDASGEDEIPLGFLDPWNEGFPEEEKLPFLEGREIAPEIYNSNFGTVLTVHSPVRYSNGEAARGFYVAADFSMERLSRERQEFFLYLSLISLAVALAFALIHWYIVRRSVVLPVYALAGAAGEFLAGQDLGRDQRSSLRKLAALSIHTGDELQVLSESLAELEKRIWAYIGNLNDPGHRPVKDSQTGLHNRDALYNNVNLFIHRFHEGNYHAFWLFDLDRFKQLNETYGRASGDEAIRGCA
ncbi:MAG: diguanylate cyclase, partial [Spirochaetaceae bacterium]|nr:diguanylate cyclase [Spirochaetaceae bacterium]